MSSRSALLAAINWPADVHAGTMSWEHLDGENSVNAMASLSPSGEIVMSSSCVFNDKRQTRFSAHIPAGSDLARVSMPGYQAHQMSGLQAVALFHAHTQSIPSKPALRGANARKPGL